jgi:hypothetical protein
MANRRKSRRAAIPASFWAAGRGVVCKVQKGGGYDVRWSQETLASMHPVIKRRCEKDGIVDARGNCGTSGSRRR